MKNLFLTITFILLFSSITFGQNKTEVISAAKKLLSEYKFKQAEQLLKTNYYNSSSNLEFVWLYAYAAHKNKNNTLSEQLYKKAISIAPKNMDLKLEYGLMLFDIGKYENANILLQDYNRKYPNVDYVESLLGQINYYLGNFKVSMVHLKGAIKNNPTDYRAKETLNNVYQIIRPWLWADLIYFEDSQGISCITTVLDGGYYQSPFFQPTFHSDVQYFLDDSTNNYQMNVLLSNDFTFQKINFNAKLTAGFNYASALSNSSFLWGINLSQKINNNLKIQAEAKRSAYSSTVMSVNSPFLSNKYNLSLLYDKPSGWMFKTGYLVETFSDTNNIQTVFVWGLSPGLKLSVFEFRIGYSFSYSTSKKSAYVSKQSLSKVIDNYVEDQQIEGVYNPYFTPKDQFANSALAIINISPSKRMSINIHSSVGFYSMTMNPYIYLDKKPNEEIVFARDFYQESYTPLDMGIKFNYNFSSTVVLKISYKYLQTFFYNSNTFQLGLRMRL